MEIEGGFGGPGYCGFGVFKPKGVRIPVPAATKFDFAGKITRV